MPFAELLRVSETNFRRLQFFGSARTGVEPALDSFGILPATVYVMSPFSEGCQLSVLPIEHTAHYALIIGSVRKANEIGAFPISACRTGRMPRPGGFEPHYSVAISNG